MHMFMRFDSWFMGKETHFESGGFAGVLFLPPSRTPLAKLQFPTAGCKQRAKFANWLTSQRLSSPLRKKKDQEWLQWGTFQDWIASKFHFEKN